jgi:NDP-sugar pyrophosphorylase family protein
MHAVILAAGKGSRLAPFTDIIPKPLMPIAVREDGSFVTIIEHLLRQIRAAGIRRVFIVVNYKAELIMSYVKEGEYGDTSISYLYQSALDGNGGAFYRAQPFLEEGESVLISDCDNYISDPEVLRTMTEFHLQRAPEITVGVSRVQRPEKFAIIKTSEGRAADIKEKPRDSTAWGNLAKSGIMILSAKMAARERSIALTAEGEYTTTQMIKWALEQGRKVELFSIEQNFHDIGTWDEYIPILRNNL